MPTHLRRTLAELEHNQPLEWSRVGGAARPNLHGLLRYPAMMVPRMQGDIIDAIVSEVGTCSVIDPFVGSGTVMTEALLRGLDFTGMDINPLALLVCEAKAAIDAGANVERAASTVIDACRKDFLETVDVDFPGLEKWFDHPSAIRLSRIRRSISSISDEAARKVLWTVFAETIRMSSNSRTSTYKLHIRPANDRVNPDRIIGIFETNLRETLQRIKAYRELISERRGRSPEIKLVCGDVRCTPVGSHGNGRYILVTSPPYGDNRTTIPYGQFSYLALRWIPDYDLHGEAAPLLANSFALDTASLGGSMRRARANGERVSGVSPVLDDLVKSATEAEVGQGLRKVANFMADLFDAFSHIRSSAPGAAFWVLTVGNRTAHGLNVPFDEICRDMLHRLGGASVQDLKRRLPNKRMPTRNNMGTLINTETTLIVEFT